MAYYLSIPDVTEAEDLLSFNRGSSDRSFDIVINAGDTAVWLFRAASEGRSIPLVILVADTLMLALDDVFVSRATAGTSSDAQMSFTLDADAVRTV